MTETRARVSVDYSANATMVTFTDQKILEETDLQATEGSVLPLVEQAGKINLILNFCNVQFLSSAALGLLLRISKKVYQYEGQLRLCSVNPKIAEIFKITRLDRVFEIYENASKAMQSLLIQDKKD